MSRTKGWKYLRVMFLGPVLLAALAVGLPSSLHAQDGTPDPRCTVEIDRWGIQLENISLNDTLAATHDLIIIDPTLDGDTSQAFSREDVAALKTGPDGQRRLVIAYLSIGQAETYRRYWRPEWQHTPPAWLSEADDAFADNFEVRYWDPEWQALVYGSTEAMLDDVIATGFDGAMLDGVDAFETWDAHHADAAQDMAAFVATLGSYARARDPGFLLLALNGENLITDETFAGAIDGMVKEDLFFGQGHQTRANPPDMVAWADAQLQMALNRGLPVFVLEYVPPGALRSAFGEMMDSAGYLGSFGERAIAQMSASHPAARAAETEAIRTFAAGAACR